MNNIATASDTIVDDPFIRIGGLSLAFSGLALALFWLSTVGYPSFAGAAVALDPLFAPGQVLHLLAALTAIYGWFALYLRGHRGRERFATVTLIPAVLGSLAFAADAALALVVFPILAREAPELIDATGAMFTGRALAFYITVFAANMTGGLLAGALALRAGIGPAPAIVAFLIGTVVYNSPPLPGLHLVHVGGGALAGAGLIFIGRSLAAKPI